MTTRMLQVLCVTTIMGAVLTITGCTISKEGTGGDKKVSIDVPGASIKVDKGDKDNDSGMPLYPGAQQVAATGDENGRAHVNLDTPFMNLKVVKMKYTSDDAPDKVLAFYRNKLGGYGTVLECKGGEDIEVGSGRGLDSPVKCSKLQGHTGEMNLKVGTEGNQHLVSVSPSGKGSSFTLVYVHLSKGKNDDDYGGKQPS